MEEKSGKLKDLNFRIRPYQSKDFDDILIIFMCNTPTYFSIDEEGDLINYLENEIEEYYVVESDGRILGCGGINFFDPPCARLSWDLIHPEFQGLGLGSLLVNFRLDRLKKLKVAEISVRTSQLAFEFYRRHGFHVVEVIEDYWAEGYDLYDMKFIG